MLGTEYCESTWVRFSEILDYDIGKGVSTHNGADQDKNKIADLYGANGVPGTTTGLLPLYAKLLCLLRDNLVPSGGNNDAIRTALVELLAHAQECL